MRQLLAALAGLFLAACAPTTPVAQSAEPALWRIADEDSEIWLFGTVHLLPRDVVWRGPRVNAAFAAADEFITETDTGPEATARFQALATELGTLPAGQTIFDDMDADTRARFDRLVREVNLEPEQFTTVRPWLAAMQLSYWHAQKQGHESEAGVENVLIEDVGTKRRSYLETPEQQVHALADLPRADQARFLAVTLRQIEQEAGMLGEMDRAWASGQLSELGEQLDAQFAEAGPAVQNALILNRNRNWADQIEKRLRGSGRIFIAVGAAHLIGEGSVVDLLRERGIEVEGP